MGDMVAYGSLTKLGEAAYSVSPTYELRGVDLFDLMETAIVKFLQGEPGHAATTKQIHRASGFREAFGDYGHRLIHKVLRESKWIERRVRGVWGLVPATFTSKKK